MQAVNNNSLLERITAMSILELELKADFAQQTEKDRGGEANCNWLMDFAVY